MDVKISLPLLPLRDIVVFPSMVIPLFVGRDKSISALNEVMKKEKKIILVTQKNSEIDDPKKTDVFMYGCEGNILQLLKLPDGTVKSRLKPSDHPFLIAPARLQSVMHSAGPSLPEFHGVNTQQIPSPVRRSRDICIKPGLVSGPGRLHLFPICNGLALV